MLGGIATMARKIRQGESSVKFDRTEVDDEERKVAMTIETNPNVDLETDPIVCYTNRYWLYDNNIGVKQVTTNNINFKQRKKGNQEVVSLQAFVTIEDIISLKAALFDYRTEAGQDGAAFAQRILFGSDFT